MPRRPLAAVVVLLLSVAAIAACGPTESDETAELSAPDTSVARGDRDGSAVQSGTDRRERMTPEATDHGADWPLPGRDYRNSRAVPNSVISSATVDDLEIAWEVPLPGRGAYGNAATTPVIVGDTVYVQDLTGAVRAIDVATGEVEWQTPGGQFHIGPNGASVGWDLVFAIDDARAVIAFDASTGGQVWRTEIVTSETAGVDIQPLPYGGLVLASTVPVSLTDQFAGGDRGVLHALDARSGEVVWTFDTVADDDLWGDPSLNSGGGAWFPPAVDVATDTIYWGIGNPAPFPGTPEFPNGSSRPGPNLYTESVVALDGSTGELDWYQQAVEHDLFDGDLMLTMLVEEPTTGQDVLVGTGKLGRVIGHDPATGAVLWDTPVGLHRNDDLTELAGPTEIAPGTFGGVLTPGSHADGVVYVAALNAPTMLEPDVASHIGSPLGQMPGVVAAVDVADGRVVWEVELPGDPLGGTTVVGDLVFTATFDGTLYALDRRDGSIVWELESPGQLNGWPAVAGDTIVWPIGLADPPRLIALRGAA